MSINDYFTLLTRIKVAPHFTERILTVLRFKTGQSEEALSTQIVYFIY